MFWVDDVGRVKSITVQLESIDLRAINANEGMHMHSEWDGVSYSLKLIIEESWTSVCKRGVPNCQNVNETDMFGFVRCSHTIISTVLIFDIVAWMLFLDISF